MGIHQWTGYVGYEKNCCKGLKHLLKLFCFSCHTPDDVGGCHRCEIGKANLMMLNYLKDNLKPNKDLDILIKCIEKEDQFYCFIRLISKFRPKTASKKYIKQQKGSLDNPKEFKNMIKNWAMNEEAYDNLSNLLERLKRKKSKY